MNDHLVNDLIYPSFSQLPADKAERILAAARREFAAKGFSGASTNVIVRECGIAKGSLFNYFRGKEGLFLYLHWREGARQLAALRGLPASLASTAHPIERMAAAVEASLALASSDPEGFAFSLSLARADASHLASRYASLFDEDEKRRMFGSVLFPDGASPDPALARLLGWLLNGVKLEIQWLVQSGADPSAAGLGDAIRSMAPWIRTEGRE